MSGIMHAVLGGTQFSPSQLFAGGVPGAWYDPTDLTTLFQDNAGTTPVTAVEQPVGAILDERATAYSSSFSSTAYYSAADSATFALGTGDFTWEAWVYATSWAATYAPLFVIYSSGTPGGLWIGKNVSNFVVRAAGVADQLQYATMPATNAWVHIAVVRSGTTLSMYYNGTRVATTTNSYSFARGVMSVGTDAGGNGLSGYMNNMRLVKGSAVYDPTNTSLTVPTGPLSAVAGTIVLTCGTAWSGNPTWTNNGASITGANPFIASPTGNHAIQATSANRPTYRARYNLLTYSEQFNNAIWTKQNTTISADVTTAPDGTTTADKLVESILLGSHIAYYSAAVTTGVVYTWSCYVKAAGRSFAVLQAVDSSASNKRFTILVNLSTGATVTTRSLNSPTNTSSSVTDAGNGWWRVSVTMAQSGGSTFYAEVGASSSGTPTWDAADLPTYLGDGTSGIYVWGAQLVTAADNTAIASTYQSIADAATYATGGLFRPYLDFNGTNSAIATAATLNLSTTNKVSVFAGLSKLSDAAFASAVELSATIASNNGTFLLAAPNSAAANYNWASKGTTQVDNIVTTYAAPTTNVVTGLGDISAPSNVIRVNGAQAGSVSTTQGTGNYGNYTMFAGARNNASSWMKGRIYELIVRGAASSALEIANAENWVNVRTGAY